jgi:phosphohistidine phosphatase
MEVYLVQHGEAKPKEEDANRPLTSRGRREVSLVSSYVAGVGIRVVQIFHSGKLRARETAQIFAEHLPK